MYIHIVAILMVFALLTTIKVFLTRLEEMPLTLSLLAAILNFGTALFSLDIQFLAGQNGGLAVVVTEGYAGLGLLFGGLAVICGALTFMGTRVPRSRLV